MPAGDPRTLDLASPDLTAVCRGNCAVAPRAVLEVHMPYQHGAELARGHVDVDADSRGVRGRNMRQELEMAGSLEPANFVRKLARSIDGASHGAQQRLLGLDAEELQLTAIVVVRIADPAQPRQSFDCGRIH